MTSKYRTRPGTGPILSKSLADILKKAEEFSEEVLEIANSGRYIPYEVVLGCQFIIESANEHNPEVAQFLHEIQKGAAAALIKQRKGGSA